MTSPSTTAVQRELLDIAERVIPGGCLGMMALPADLRMVMVRGQGSKVYDAAGKEYLDYCWEAVLCWSGIAGPRSWKQYSVKQLGAPPTLR